MAGLWTILKALPSIIGLINQLIKLMKGNPVADYIKKSGAAYKELNQAKNINEKRAAAKKIQDLISGL